VVVIVVVDYICEEYNNPPDFFLDVLNGSVSLTAVVTSDEMKLPNGQLSCLVVLLILKRKETVRCVESHTCPDHPLSASPIRVVWVGGPGHSHPCQALSKLDPRVPINKGSKFAFPVYLFIYL